MNNFLFFFAPFITTLVISYLIKMTIKILHHPRYFLGLAIFLTLTSFFIFVWWFGNLTGLLTINDFRIAFITTISFSVLIFLVALAIILFYEFKREESDLLKNSNVIAVIVAIISAIAVTIPVLIVPSYIMEELDRDAFMDNIKGAIFIYDNETGHENITMIVCNNGKTTYKAPIIMSISFFDKKGQTHTISLRIRRVTDIGVMYDISGNIRPEPTNESNFSKFIWHLPEYSLSYKEKGEPTYLYANISVNWTYNQSIVHPNQYYFEVEGEKISKENIAIIEEKPKLRVGKIQTWDISKVFEQILEYT